MDGYFGIYVSFVGNFIGGSIGNDLLLILVNGGYY